MQEQGRYGILVSCEHDAEVKDVRSITVTFGQGNRVRVSSHMGRPELRLSSGVQSVRLDAGANSQDLSWAVELLAAHLPQLRRQLGLYESEGDTDGA